MPSRIKLLRQEGTTQASGAPRVRVVYLPGHHDYLGALYGAMSSGGSAAVSAILPVPRPERQDPRELLAFWREADLVHIGWPEHLVLDASPGCEAHARRTSEALDALERTGVLVAWTMHNRLPHFWPEAAGAALYRRMATLAHVVIHHSRWGMREMRTRLCYRGDAIHGVIPHGHYATAMEITEDRAECERQCGLTPSALRFGIIGRPQAQKRVADIVSAFLAGAGPGRQLLVAAVAPSERISTDPRLAVRPRSRWLTRHEIAMQVRCCDCLVAWHVGDSYLTSGLVADAIGVGVPMLVNGDWPFWTEILGDAAITYAGTDGLSAAFGSVETASIARGALAAKALRAAYDWNRSAEWTATLFLRAVAARPRL
jgi:hypothetical protein